MADNSRERDIAVLLVTTDGQYAEVATERLRERGPFRVTRAASMESALEKYHAVEPACLVSDYTLPEADGLALLSAVRSQDPALPFFVCADGDDEVAKRAIAAGATDFFPERERRGAWDDIAELLADAVAYYRSRPETEVVDSPVQAVLDAAEEAIAIARDGRFAFVNAACVDLFAARSREALQGDRLAAAIEAEPSAYLPESSDRDPENPVTKRIETEVRQASGALVPVSLTATPVEWEGQAAVTLVLRDLSEHKRRLEELTLKHRAMDNAPVGISIADASESDTPLIYVNEGFEQLTGYAEEDVVGRNCRFLQGPETAQEPVQQMRDAIDAEEEVTVELRNYRADGTPFWNWVRITPLRNDAGEVTHYLGFQEEITEQVQREQQLGVLERVLRHNLRNDVNVMTSQAELIAEGVADDPEASARKIIDRGQQLVALADKERSVTDLLSEQPEARPCDVTSVIERTVTSLRTQYTEADVSLSLPPGQVSASTVPAIDQALFELVENAIKHGDRETPSVGITVESDGDAVEVRVADEGPPIPETERAIISGDVEIDSLTHGTGVGLWLTNWIVTHSGGSLSFETEGGDGNVVRITLPLASDPDDGNDVVDGVDRRSEETEAE